jgi:hypothetical protein
MKKSFWIMIVLVSGLFQAVSLGAQTAESELKRQQEMYLEYLKTEGYIPTLDQDGDILFKIAGSFYFLMIDENDPEFFQLYKGINLESTPMQDALEAANYTNRRSKVAKMYITTDGTAAIIKVEMLLKEPDAYKAVFKRCISILQNAESIFASQF